MRAECTKCGKTYSWSGRRGARLKDHPSPCCLAPGRAVRTGLYVTRGVKRCPDCGKGGLQYRKALLAGLKRTDPFDPKNDRSKLAVDSGDITAGSYSRDFGWSMYCPRCKKWVYPVRREAPSAPA